MTNNNNSDRLDRMEALLEVTIQGLSETRKLTESNSRAIAETRKLTESNSRAIAETKKITESNSRTIQAMLEQRATDRLEHEQRMRREEERIKKSDELIKSIASVQKGLSRMLSSLDDDRPTILRKLTTIENKLDRIIEEK